MWNNNSVKWWYRQNTLLFVEKNKPLKNLEAFRAIEQPVLDIVNPINYEGKKGRINSYENRIQYPSLRFCLGCIKRYIQIKLRSWMHLTPIRPPFVKHKTATVVGHQNQEEKWWLYTINFDINIYSNTHVNNGKKGRGVAVSYCKYC